MIKLTHLISAFGALIFLVTGAGGVAMGVFSNPFLLIFGILILAYGVACGRFNKITKIPTLQYCDYKKLMGDCDKIPYKKAFSVKRYSIIMISLGFIPLLISLGLMYLIASDGMVREDIKAFLGSLMILVISLSQIYYSVGVYQSIGSK